MLYNVNADTDKQQSIFPTTLTVESKKMHKKKKNRLQKVQKIRHLHLNMQHSGHSTHFFLITYRTSRNWDLKFVLVVNHGTNSYLRRTLTLPIVLWNIVKYREVRQRNGSINCDTIV